MLNRAKCSKVVGGAGVQVSQYHFLDGQWFPSLPEKAPNQLLLSFGGRKYLQDDAFRAQLTAAFPVAENIGCTTSGEILSTEVYDESLVVTAIHFNNTPIKAVSVNLSDYNDSIDAGIALAGLLDPNHLSYVMLIADGQFVNGSELVAGLSKHLPNNLLITGGMAGDGDRFSETVVWHNQQVSAGRIVACGFYGDSIRVGHGTLGGWNAFGPVRTVTRSSGNILYELDQQPALDLYKKYLGEFSQQLPASALRFPLSVQMPNEKESVVRTILSINETDKSMVFAGDIPQGAITRLMKANFETLIDGASQAASGALSSLRSDEAKLAILISCVGRRLVLKQRVFEELEAVEEVITADCPMCGYYSYGEISPLLDGTRCRLHNQTMTITTLSEVNDA